MFRNYLKTAVRSLLKNKFYSILNISGLSIGIACTIIIFLFIQHELNVDTFNNKYDRIYRVGADISLGERQMKLAQMPAPAAQTFLEEYPEVEQVVRFRHRGDYIFQYEEKSFKELGVLFADSTLFDVFSLEVLQGNAQKALSVPFSIALSKSMAEKYFGCENPIGKALKVNNDINYNITAVFKDIPNNSHIKADCFVSINSLDDANNPGEWLSFNFPTYIVLKPNSDIASVDDKFPSTIKKYCEPLFLKFIGKSLDELAAEGGHTYFFTEPLSDVYLYTDAGNDIGGLGNIQYVYIFSAIALFVLIIACINFVNLSTAHSTGRAKEVGIRKTLGSFRKDLISQFLIESIILSSLATILAIGIVELSLPGFNNLASRSLTSEYLNNIPLVLIILFIPPIVGLLAGIYPAFIISKFQPVSILKDKAKTGIKSGFLRNSLVILQFSASIILIVGTITVFQQLEYIQNKKIGYDKEQVLILNDAYLLGDQVYTLKNEMLNNSNILSATASGYLPVPSSRNNSAVIPNNQPDNPKTTPVQIFRVDFDYVKTMGIEIIKGRDFSREFSSDSSAMIINEAAAKHFEWDNPMDNTISVFVNGEGETKTHQIIGVARDFNFESLHDKVGPLVMIIGNSKGHISFRLKTKNIDEVISQLEDKWKEFAPNQPFSYSFMDERFDQMYENEKKLGETFGVFAGLAIFIGCLGLFGLSAFTAQKRTKEIGIRKVMGASVPGIVTLLGKEFVKLMIISFLIAAPLSYYLMDMWLQDFAYRTSLGIGIFILAGILSFLVAILTVSYHSIRSALANPVDSIKHE